MSTTSALIDLTAERDEFVDVYGPIKKSKKSHSKGRSGRYNQASPNRINKGGASSLDWVNWLIDHRDAGFFQRMLRNLKVLREACADPDPDNIGCVLTNNAGSDHRRTSTEAFREDIEQAGGIANTIPMRVSAHVLALIAAGKRLPNTQPPAHPFSKRRKGAYWTASHLCHNKSCINPDHLVWEPNWANRQRDGCLGKGNCVHTVKCIRAHRRAETWIGPNLSSQKQSEREM
jgi:hypothetical protein